MHKKNNGSAHCLGNILFHGFVSNIIRRFSHIASGKASTPMLSSNFSLPLYGYWLRCSRNLDLCSLPSKTVVEYLGINKRYMEMLQITSLNLLQSFIAFQKGSAYLFRDSVRQCAYIHWYRSLPLPPCRQMLSHFLFFH